ncbi:MAG TPA: MaoC family dehydratase [Pseudonocardiaceae bacterium]|nr:MaoC family dehydratase [Pseudonocardiaceae bacterium]
MKMFTGAQDVLAAVGEQLGTSDWMVIDQQRVAMFADATEDHQWIHIDPGRAARGPFGTTIAHGFLILSLLPHLVFQTYQVTDAAMTINYGLNKVRFPAPVPVGSRIRADVALAEATKVTGGVQLVLRVTLQIESAPKPGCVAEWVIRVQFPNPANEG